MVVEPQEQKVEEAIEVVVERCTTGQRGGGGDERTNLHVFGISLQILDEAVDVDNCIVKNRPAC